MGKYGYIYIIENDVNNKLYVGQTISPEDGRTYRRCYICIKSSNRETYHRKKLKNKREF